MAHANYIWIGKPPAGEHLGQDTLGPKTMREAMPEQSITFWCLKSQEAHYKDVYKGLNIEVLSIEDAIPLPNDKKLMDFIDLCLKRARLLESMLENPDHADEASQRSIRKDIAREYISIKDVMIYYLQTQHQLAKDNKDCQYFFDTNVIIQDDVEIQSLVDLEQFAAPFHKGRYDPWLMVITKRERSAARERFDSLLDKYTKSYERFHLEAPTGNKMQRQTYGSRNFLGAAYVSGCIDATKLEMLAKERYLVYLDILLQKIYMNTHIPSKVCDSEPLAIRIIKGHRCLLLLKHLLSEGSFHPANTYVTEAFDSTDSPIVANTNIFIDICNCINDKSAELAILIDALDDISILFFNDKSINYEHPPICYAIQRFSKQPDNKELEVLLKKCFERHPTLQRRCYQLISQLTGGVDIKDIQQLMKALIEDDNAYAALIYTFLPTIPAQAQRNIPGTMDEIGKYLAELDLKAPVGGFFDEAKEPISKEHEIKPDAEPPAPPTAFGD